MEYAQATLVVWYPCYRVWTLATVPVSTVAPPSPGIFALWKFGYLGGWDNCTVREQSISIQVECNNNKSRNIDKQKIPNPNPRFYLGHLPGHLPGAAAPGSVSSDPMRP